MGGASVNNPFSWKLGSLNLKFPEVTKTVVSDDDEYRYKAKPIIEVGYKGEIVGVALLLLWVWLYYYYYCYNYFSICLLFLRRDLLK